MKRILLVITVCMGLLSSLRAQQQEEIIGRVQDAQTDRPLAGATLILKKNKTSAITDQEGHFSLKISFLPDTLMIRSVGHTSQFLPVNGMPGTPLIIRLQALSMKLDDVVVSTGYQSLPAERATGSFTQINNEDLNRQVGSHILDRLKGIASSVTFPSQNLDGAPSIMVRGLSTINGPKEPLIVVDNFPYDGDIGNINPNDVESITILKDAAASSIWGARAGNGVIVITTKKGKYDQPMRVQFNSNIVVTGKPNLDNIRTISSRDYIDVEKFLFAKGYYDALINGNAAYPALSPVVQILARQRSGMMSGNEAEAKMRAYEHTDIRDQYLKYMYQPALAQQYALNLQGGSKKFAYYVSGGYDGNRDELASKSKRYTFRSQNSFAPTKDFEIKLNVQYTQSQLTSGKPGYGSIDVNGVNIPYLRLADNQGYPLAVAKVWKSIYTDTAGAGKLLDWKFYPLTDWQHQTGVGKQQDFQTDFSLHYKLPLGFSLDVFYRYERQSHEARNLSDIDSYYARDLINQFSEIDFNTGIVTYHVPLGGILRVSNDLIQGQDMRGQLNFNRTFAKSRVTGFIGAEARQALTDGNSFIDYGYDKHTLTTATVDYVNAYPRYITGRYSRLPLQQGSLEEKLNRYISVYGNAAWTYKDKYILSGSARKDASNLFGATSNNKWNLLWSAGVGWILSKEAWVSSQTLSYLKIRATYGYSGNTDPGRTALLTFAWNNTPSGLPGNHSVSVISTPPNPGLRWETVKTMNAGVDFEISSGRISGSIEAYIKNGFDLYGPEQQDPSTGLGLHTDITKNVADMEGRGMDITLNGKILEGKFNWDTHLIFSYNTDKIIQYNSDTSLLSGSLLNSGSSISPLPGKSVYSIVALKWAGLNNKGEPMGYADGKISSDYAAIYNYTRRSALMYRPVLPRYFGSLINDFTYGRFSLSICLNYRFGYYFMKPSLSYSQLFSYGAVVGTAEYANRWKEAGDEKHTNVPPIVFPADNYRDFFYGASMANVLSASNVKLQYVNIGYQWSKTNTAWLPIRHLEVYANVNNLGLLWKANDAGLDPDFNGPVPGKALTLGIKANF